MKKDAIAAAVRKYFSEIKPIPDNVRSLAGDAKCDLYDGPLYLDEDGEECSCFDEGARQFDFDGAVERIRCWLENSIPSHFYYDEQLGECFASEKAIEDDWVINEDGELVLTLDPSDYWEISYEDVARHLFGSELASYL